MSETKRRRAKGEDCTTKPTRFDEIGKIEQRMLLH